MERKKIKDLSSQRETYELVISGSPAGILWKRFSRNILSVTGGIVILAVFLLALFAYLIIPDSTPHANEQHLELSTRKPGFSVRMLRIKKNEKIPVRSLSARLLSGQPGQFNRIPIDTFCFQGDRIVITTFNDVQGEKGFVQSYSLPDVVFPLDYEATPFMVEDGVWRLRDVHGRFHDVSIRHLKEKILEEHIIEERYPLGTDRFGRDLLSRLILGARISLSVGFIAVFISLVLGITMGSVAGYFRGYTDRLIMWLINVVWSIPTLLLAITITLVLGKGFWQVFVAVGLTMWVEVARVVRGQVLSLREKEYVEAGRALGYSHSRLLFRHIVPNALSPVIIIAAANFASAILIEAGLSFLGIGIQPPLPSWGSMIRDHYGYFLVDMAYLAVLPGVAIMILVLAFTMIGNGFRDALDTRNLVIAGG